MSENELIFDNAPIKPDWYGVGFAKLFVIQPVGGSVWFDVDFEFEANGNDFFAVIDNFGRSRPAPDGSKTSVPRREFTLREIESARHRFLEYFLGPEDKFYIPFNVYKAQCFGPKFAPGWALVKGT